MSNQLAGWLAGLMMMVSLAGAAQEPVRLYAAGSLRVALTEVLTYCTNAILAAKEAPGLKVILCPEALAVGAEYGLTVMNGASENATKLYRFILSVPGQEILVKHGFARATP